MHVVCNIYQMNKNGRKSEKGLCWVCKGRVNNMTRQTDKTQICITLYL